MTDESPTTVEETVSSLALMRQWMELVTEFIEERTRHEEFSHKLPYDWAHKMELMKVILEKMPESAQVEVEPKYTCTNAECGFKFDRPIPISLGGSHYGGVGGQGCPRCRYLIN